jgi:hypothetical protein
MAKRRWLTLKCTEYCEIRRAAFSRQMSIAEWVRETLQSALTRKRGRTVPGKLDIIRIAARHNFPVSDIEDMLAEIRRGGARQVSS